MTRVLLITDTDRVLRIFESLEAKGTLQLRTAATLDQADLEISETVPDFTFVQSRVSGFSGEILLRHLKKVLPKGAKTILLTGDAVETAQAKKVRTPCIDLTLSDEELAESVGKAATGARIAPPKKAAAPKEAATPTKKAAIPGKKSAQVPEAADVDSEPGIDSKTADIDPKTAAVNPQAAAAVEPKSTAMPETSASVSKPAALEPKAAAVIPNPDVVDPKTAAALEQLAAMEGRSAARRKPVPEPALVPEKFDLFATAPTPETPEQGEEPLLLADLPAAANEQPSVATNQPEVAANQPELAASLPELAASLPELAASQPELAANQPELAANQPELAASQPELAASQPELAANQPELAASLPELVASFPELAASLPELAASLSEVELNKPAVATNKFVAGTPATEKTEKSGPAVNKHRTKPFAEIMELGAAKSDLPVPGSLTVEDRLILSAPTGSSPSQGADRSVWPLEQEPDDALPKGYVRGIPLADAMAHAEKEKSRPWWLIIPVLLAFLLIPLLSYKEGKKIAPADTAPVASSALRPVKHAAKVPAPVATKAHGPDAETAIDTAWSSTPGAIQHPAPQMPPAVPTSTPAKTASLAPAKPAAPTPAKTAAAVPAPAKAIPSVASSKAATAPVPVKVATPTTTVKAATVPAPVKAAAVPAPSKAAVFPAPVKAAASLPVKAAASLPVKVAAGAPAKPVAPAPVKAAAPTPAKIAAPATAPLVKPENRPAIKPDLKQPAIPDPRQAARPIPAPEAKPAAKAGLKSLPASVASAKLDSAYGKTHPGWQRYVDKNVEYTIFKEDDTFRAMQVIALGKETVSTPLFKKLLMEFGGIKRFQLQSSVDKGDYLMERGVAKGGLSLTIYRKKNDFKVKGLVLYFQ